MKGAWMLVVSLRGAIFGLTYGVLGKTPLSLAVKVSFCFIYAFHVIKVYLRVKKGWATPRLVSFRDLIQKFRPSSPPLSYGNHPPPPPLSSDGSSVGFSGSEISLTWRSGSGILEGKEMEIEGEIMKVRRELDNEYLANQLHWKTIHHLIWRRALNTFHLDLRYRRFVIRSTVNKGCIQSKSKSVHWKACLVLRSE